MNARHLGTIWRTPLSRVPLFALGVILLVGGAVYCMGHASLSGNSNQWLRAFGWSAVAVLPWFILFEFVKRAERQRDRPLRPPALIGLLMATALVSLSLEELVDRLIWETATAPLALQMLRRLPALVFLAALLLARRAEERQSKSNAGGPVSVDPVRLRYARAADNYVECHYGDRTELVRATLAGVARQLEGHGFVRVHRSFIVHPHHVARVEPGDRTPVLHLTCGERLPTGERYRTAIRHFVP